MKAKEVLVDFQKTLGDSSYSTDAKWTKEFKFSQESLEDVATSPEIIAQEHDIVLEDCQLKFCEISEAVGILFEFIYHIVIHEFGLKK